MTDDVSVIILNDKQIAFTQNGKKLVKMVYGFSRKQLVQIGTIISESSVLKNKPALLTKLQKVLFKNKTLPTKAALTDVILPIMASYHGEILLGDRMSHRRIEDLMKNLSKIEQDLKQLRLGWVAN